MGTTQSKQRATHPAKQHTKTIDANSTSYGMSPMAASYADGFRLIKEKPCKHAAGFLRGNQPPRNRKMPTGNCGHSKSQEHDVSSSESTQPNSAKIEHA